MQKSIIRPIGLSILGIANFLFRLLYLAVNVSYLFAVFDTSLNFDIVEKFRICFSVLIYFVWVCFFLKILLPFKIDHRKTLMVLLLTNVSAYVLRGTFYWIQAYPRMLEGVEVPPSIYSTVFAFLTILCPAIVLFLGLLKRKDTEKLAAILYVIGFVAKHVEYISSFPGMYKSVLTYISMLVDLAFIVLLFIHPVLSEPIVQRKKSLL